MAVEALIRWRHPELGMVPPADFIPIAETTDLIHQMTYFVLCRALKDSRKWLDQGRRLLMCINISVRNLMHPDFF